MSKTFVCSDESVNSYGFRVLTSGIDISDFLKNPIMLFNHERYSFGADVYNGPIGRWENIKKDDGRLLADPVIDEDDPKGKIIANKVEKDFIRASSIGIQILKTSGDPADLLPGQTRATVTKSKLIEISIVDVPANKNALALFDENGQKLDLNDDGTLSILSLGKPAELPPINNSMKKYSLKAAWVGLLGLLSLKPEEGKDTVEHEFTEEELADLNKLATDKTELDSKVVDLTTKLASVEKDRDKYKQLSEELQAKIDKLPAGAATTEAPEENEKLSADVNGDTPEFLNADDDHNKLAEAAGL